MTRYELERHLGKYVEIVLFDGTVIEGILHKTSEKAFENEGFHRARADDFFRYGLEISRHEPHLLKLRKAVAHA